ncbi:hypothetical protein [Rossellomorea sp. NPDC077527]|uniref:hypothetical protein n=1 Tax=Rossellomorea sp. NPDC077527 TaxID=3364510 RepID=UPI0037CC9D67
MRWDKLKQEIKTNEEQLEVIKKRILTSTPNTIDYLLKELAEKASKLGQLERELHELGPKPIILSIEFSDYVPGMRLYLWDEHEDLEQGQVVLIEEVNNEWSDYHFIVEKGVKINWNKTPVSCAIHSNETTEFLNRMFIHFESEAKRMLAFEEMYGWSQTEYERYLWEKNETLIDLLIEYEHERVKEIL